MTRAILVECPVDLPEEAAARAWLDGLGVPDVDLLAVAVFRDKAFLRCDVRLVDESGAREWLPLVHEYAPIVTVRPDQLVERMHRGEA